MKYVIILDKFANILGTEHLCDWCKSIKRANSTCIGSYVSLLVYFILARCDSAEARECFLKKQNFEILELLSSYFMASPVTTVMRRFVTQILKISGYLNAYCLR